jgi:alpha-ribazole phosphatase
MRIILIRHGKTEANEKHLYCGKTDLSLSENGREELIRKKHNRVYPSASGFSVITSGKKRCEETLNIIYGNIPHTQNEAFCEMDFGAFEMRSYEEMKNDPSYIAWISGDNEKNVCPGGESGEIMQKRVIDGLNETIADCKDFLLVTHGGVIAVIMAELFPEEEKNRYEWQPVAGEGYMIEITERSRSYILF